MTYAHETKKHSRKVENQSFTVSMLRQFYCNYHNSYGLIPKSTWTLSGNRNQSLR